MARDIRVRYIIDSTLSEIGKRKNFKKSYSKKIKQMRHVNQLCSPFFLFLAVEIKKGQHKSLDSFFSRGAILFNYSNRRRRREKKLTFTGIQNSPRVFFEPVSSRSRDET